jgi:uncharacterized membrane protein (UPF0127 family)
MKIPLLIFAILAVIILVLIKVDYLNSKSLKAEVNGHVFFLYLAQTPQEQEIGLARFNKIEKNQGMLFIYQDSDYYSFWMKGMKFPIDIIFINKDRVVDIFQNVPVVKDNNFPTYKPREKADKILEINAGLTNKYGIKTGTKVRLKL